jgi:hypothetical protein
VLIELATRRIRHATDRAEEHDGVHPDPVHEPVG